MVQILLKRIMKTIGKQIQTEDFLEDLHANIEYNYQLHLLPIDDL